MEYIGTATYSPDDNKIRITPFARLEKDLYDRLRANGYIWAPMQKIFFAPMWTPSREDLAAELCGEIEDEDKSLIERAEERSERFEQYGENRANDAEKAYGAVSVIAENIPMGQPILVGHHSEKRARRDAEKIESGMRKAVKMWEISKYWEDRAQGAISHAKYKELPRTRARRIKVLEADKRKQERAKKESEYLYKFWNSEITLQNSKTGEKRLVEIKNENRSFIFELVGRMSHYGVSVRGIDGQSWYSAYDILRPDEEKYKNCPTKTVEELRDIALRLQKESILHSERWILHIENRLIYEKAMLEEQGASALIEKKARPTQLPLCNYRAPEGIKIKNRWNGEADTYQQIEMTKEEYAKIYTDHKGCLNVENSHRVRACFKFSNGSRSQNSVFIVDLKETPKPEPKEKEYKQAIEKRQEEKAIKTLERVQDEPVQEKNKNDEKFKSLKQNLKKGVQVVSAPELFPTPSELVERMVIEADIQEGERILEPSAGTGNIIGKIIEENDQTKMSNVWAVEVNNNLGHSLSGRFPNIHVFIEDFLSCNGELGLFDKIIMNPPFSADVEHVLHAYDHLKENGRIVAIMSEHSFFANDKKSVTFREFLETVGTSEKLPSDTFKTSGTSVNTRLVVINKVA